MSNSIRADAHSTIEALLSGRLQREALNREVPTTTEINSNANLLTSTRTTVVRLVIPFKKHKGKNLST